MEMLSSFRETSMSSVLLSLSLSMFAVDQALASHMHDCIESCSSDISSGGADICDHHHQQMNSA